MIVVVFLIVTIILLLGLVVVELGRKLFESKNEADTGGLDEEIPIVTGNNETAKQDEQLQ